MRYTLAAIMLLGAGLLVAAARSGRASGLDLVMMAVGIVVVCVSASVPVVLGARSRRAAARQIGPRRVVKQPGSADAGH